MGEKTTSIKRKKYFFGAVFATALILDGINKLFSLKHLDLPFVDTVILLFPVVLLISHSIWTLGWRKAFCIISLAMIVGGTMEHLGLKYGTIFGGRYVYFMNGLYVFGVPVWVLLYWAIFIYTGYHVVNSFLAWLGVDKPQFGKNHWMYPLAVLADGVVVTSLDLLLDPLQVHSGNWIWLDKGWYFGIPMGNFVGWFVVTIMVTGVFRLYEFFNTKKTDNSANGLLIFPVIGYGLLGITLMISSLMVGLYGLFFVGLLTIIPVFLVNLFLYQRYNVHPKML